MKYNETAGDKSFALTALLVALTIVLLLGAFEAAFGSSSPVQLEFSVGNAKVQSTQLGLAILAVDAVLVFVFIQKVPLNLMAGSVTLWQRLVYGLRRVALVFLLVGVVALVLLGASFVAAR